MNNIEKSVNPVQKVIEKSLRMGLPDGWYKSFGTDFALELTNLLSKLELLDDFEILQVKEKYGAMRFYYAPYNYEIDRVVEKYEKLSAKTCVLCGKPAKYKTIGWVLPYCSSCIESETKAGTEFHVELIK